MSALNPDCAHCQKPQQGSAHVVVAGVQYPLCHVDPEEGPDCYRLVTVDHHLLLGCPCIVLDERWTLT